MKFIMKYKSLIFLVAVLSIVSCKTSKKNTVNDDVKNEKDKKELVSKEKEAIFYSSF